MRHMSFRSLALSTALGALALGGASLASSSALAAAAASAADRASVRAPALPAVPASVPDRAIIAVAAGGVPVPGWAPVLLP